MLLGLGTGKWDYPTEAGIGCISFTVRHGAGLREGSGVKDIVHCDR